MPLTLLKSDKAIPEREKHTYIKESSENILPLSNVQTTPGDFTERGCTYAGCLGVVCGPIKDVIHLVHGPIGCAYWTWGGGTRQNLSDNPGFHRKYCFSTDMQEDNIIFGGEDKLYKSIIEAHEEFPEAKGVFVYATCAIGLIGDDLNGVCKRAEDEIGIRVVPFNCEGFRGCSQSLGHHIANDTLFERVVGTKEPEYMTDYDMNIIGDYNIQGDLWEIMPLFERMGIRILSTFTGNASVDDIAQAHRARGRCGCGYFRLGWLWIGNTRWLGYGWHTDAKRRVGCCKKENLNYFATWLPTKREGKEEKEVGQGQRNITGAIADKCEDT